MNFKINETVTINNLPATIKYIGATYFADGVWVGLELSTPSGKHDGTLNGIKYFNCKPKHGIFVRESYLETSGKTTTTLMDYLSQVSQFENETLRTTMYCHYKSLDCIIEDRDNLTKEIIQLEEQLKQINENSYQETIGINQENEIEYLSQMLEQVNSEIQYTEEEIKSLDTNLDSLENIKLDKQLQIEMQEILLLNRELEETEKEKNNEKKKLKTQKQKTDSLQIDLKFAQSTGDRQLKKIDLKIKRREKLINDLEIQRKNLIKQLSSPRQQERVEQDYPKIQFLEREINFTENELKLYESRNIQKPMATQLAFSKNKHKWIPIILKRNPQILETRERMKVFTKKLSFSRFYQTVKNDKVKLIAPAFVIRLIIQHYKKEKKNTIADFLEKKFAIKEQDFFSIDSDQLESHLYSLVRFVLPTYEILFHKNFRQASNIGETQEENEIETLRLHSDDLSIWNEQPDNIKNIIFDEKEKEKFGAKSSANVLKFLVSANKNKLIERLTWHEDSDPEFIRLFLTTHKYIMESEYLLLKLFQRYNVPKKIVEMVKETEMKNGTGNGNGNGNGNGKGKEKEKVMEMENGKGKETGEGEGEEKEMEMENEKEPGSQQEIVRETSVSQEEYKKLSRVIKIKVFSVLHIWLSNFYGDFSPTMLRMISDFARQDLANDNISQSKQLQKLLKKMKINQNKRRKPKFNERPPRPNIPKNIFSNHLEISDINEKELAKQLTLFTHKGFCQMKPCELISACVSKNIPEDFSPNLYQLRQSYFYLRSYFAWSILRFDKFKERAKQITRIIKIAQQLAKLHNFENLFSIIHALSMEPIRRLRFSFAEVPKSSLKTLSELEKITSSNKNFKNQRKILKNVSSAAAIPFHGVYLIRMKFVHQASQGEQFEDSNNQINFTKIKALYNIIFEVMKFQNKNYNLLKVKQIWFLFKKLTKIYRLKDLKERSLLLEKEGFDKRRDSKRIEKK
ncbi:guanine nucleotide exchange factor [Anaeramoeba flamelloides]|uniref:Guanine nucleotide exchange factor n=1 Tax=Anaeramoeba flamelloides TaxID=1746091 RepID=A0ABQ8YF40_9EUKA|nr:guanine nucleotide exchange factor [Anaeramoeba flamelloides]